jgi:hypothetical protein
VIDLEGDNGMRSLGEGPPVTVPKGNANRDAKTYKLSRTEKVRFRPLDALDAPLE